MARTIQRETVEHVAHAPLRGAGRAFRAVIEDGSARVLVADRRHARNQADVRVRAPKAVTVRHAANAIAHRCDGWTREDVLAFHGVEDDTAAPARGSLREEYLAILAREGRA